MSDILIKGMEMPPQCYLKDEYGVRYWSCPFLTESKWDVLICCPDGRNNVRIVNDYYASRHPTCPIVFLPEKYGELIERKSAKVRFCQNCHWKHELGEHACEVCAGCPIDMIPTIIEASE